MKISLLSISVVFMLLAVSFVSAVEVSSITNVKKKESPLYRIRSRIAIGEKIKKILIISFLAVLVLVAISFVFSAELCTLEWYRTVCFPTT